MAEPRPPGMRFLASASYVPRSARRRVSRIAILVEKMRRRWTMQSRSIICDSTTAAMQANAGADAVGCEELTDLPGKDR